MFPAGWEKAWSGGSTSSRSVPSFGSSLSGWRLTSRSRLWRSSSCTTTTRTRGSWCTLPTLCLRKRSSLTILRNSPWQEARKKSILESFHRFLSNGPLCKSEKQLVHVWNQGYQSPTVKQKVLLWSILHEDCFIRSGCFIICQILTPSISQWWKNPTQDRKIFNKILQNKFVTMVYCED